MTYNSEDQLPPLHTDIIVDGAGDVRMVRIDTESFPVDKKVKYTFETKGGSLLSFYGEFTWRYAYVNDTVQASQKSLEDVRALLLSATSGIKEAINMLSMLQEKNASNEKAPLGPK